MECPGALLALPCRLVSAVAPAVRVPHGAEAGGAGCPAAVILPPWLPPRGLQSAPNRRRRPRPRCCSGLERARPSPSSLRVADNRRGAAAVAAAAAALAPAEQAAAAAAGAAALAMLAAPATRPGGDRALGGKGFQDHSGVGGGAAGWRCRKRRQL